MPYTVDVSQELEDIKLTPYGKKMRPALHSSIDKLSKKQNQMAATFDSLIIDAGQNNAEVVAARVDAEANQHASLKDRLDADQQEVIDARTDAKTPSVTHGNLKERLDNDYNHWNTEISNIKVDLDVIKANSKYMLELYCGDAARQTTEYVTNHIRNGKKSGFNEICLLIYLQDDGTTLEDINRFAEYNQIARDLGMPITCLKLHGTYTYPNYLPTLYDGLDKLPDVNTVFIFNEQFKDVYANGLDHPSQIKLNYPQVKKVGCTVSYGTAFKDWTANASDEIEIIQTKYDILGVHMYPSCGNFEEARQTTYEQCIKAFNEFELLIPWKKEIWLTESGVLPYWQFLELPESYTVSNLSDKERTIDPQRLFYRALFNCNFSQQAKVVIPWYTESWNYDDTVEMWEVIRHIIKNI